MLIQKKGFTLLELVFAMAIMIPLLLGIIGVNVYALHAGETSRSITTATQHAHTVIEQIRNKSRQGLSQAVAAYPNNQAFTSSALATALSIQQSNLLTGEQITVSYVDTNADPLAVTANVSWTDLGRNMQRSFKTWVTQR